MSKSTLCEADVKESLKDATSVVRGKNREVGRTSRQKSIIRDKGKIFPNDRMIKALLKQ